MRQYLHYSEPILAKFITGRKRHGIIGNGLAGFTCLIDGQVYPDRESALRAVESAAALIGGLYSNDRLLTPNEAANLYANREPE